MKSNASKFTTLLQFFLYKTNVRLERSKAFNREKLSNRWFIMKSGNRCSCVTSVKLGQFQTKLWFCNSGGDAGDWQEFLQTNNNFHGWLMVAILFWIPLNVFVWIQRAEINEYHCNDMLMNRFLCHGLFLLLKLNFVAEFSCWYNIIWYEFNVYAYCIYAFIYTYSRHITDNWNLYSPIQKF